MTSGADSKAKSPIIQDPAVLDLEFCGHGETIASALLIGDGEVALVDGGPSSCLPALRARLAKHGLRVADITALLLTHIHFDHAGATGSLVRENPKLRVYVHEIGARHLADPQKLLSSASRLYGDALYSIFGEFLPVPAENIHALRGGETFRAAGRNFEVAYTPGHAQHHVSYFDEATGTAFTGDTTGLRMPNFSVVAPLAPPPDIDLAAWDRSLAEIERRRPSQLFLTHFGPFANVGEHLNATREGLHRWAERANSILASAATEDERTLRFVQESEDEYRAQLPAAVAAKYAGEANATLSWYGLSRYWRKRAERAPEK